MCMHFLFMFANAEKCVHKCLCLLMLRGGCVHAPLGFERHGPVLAATATAREICGVLYWSNSGEVNA